MKMESLETEKQIEENANAEVLESESEEMTEEKLLRLNAEHFKDNLNAVPFCLDCDLENFVYCDKCASKQIKKLSHFLED
jgi:hypothetical protein